MMTIQFDNNAEAFASVAIVVMAADNVGSREEQIVLFDKVKELVIFSDYDEDGFMALLSAVTEKVYSSLPVADLFITEDGLAILCQAVCEVLDADLRLEAYSMAVGLIRSDEATKEEMALLAGLHGGLDLS
jgi:hypothetical protein